VDDIKLITAVDERDTLGRFPQIDAVVHAIDEVLSMHHPDAFPLLRRKLRTVFAPESIGLDTVHTTDRENWRCYIPLSERTVDAVYYYPCSVYVREGGRPLGRISDSPERQWANTANFVRHGRCLDDPICRKYCLHCTKAFNVAANEARSQLKTHANGC